MDELFNSGDESSDLEDAFYCKACDKGFSGHKPLVQHMKSAKHHKALLKKKRGRQRESEKEVEEEDDENVVFDQGPLAVCKACKKEFGDPEAYKKHLSSSRHKKKVKMAKILEQVSEGGQVDIEKLKEIQKKAGKFASEIGNDAATDPPDLSDDEDDPVKVLQCDVCRKAFSGAEPYLQHVLSKTHEKAVKQRKILRKITEKAGGLDLGGPSSEQQTEAPSAGETESPPGIQVVDDVITCKLCHTSFSGPENAAAHLRSRGHAKRLKNRKWKNRLASSGQKDGHSSGDDGESSDGGGDGEAFAKSKAYARLVAEVPGSRLFESNEEIGASEAVGLEGEARESGNPDSGDESHRSRDVPKDSDPVVKETTI